MSITQTKRQAIPVDVIAESIEKGWQLPSSFYADPRIHDIEQDVIFKKSWQCVGRVNSLNNPGDYITAQVGDVPVVVVLDENAQLRAHVNACRHRLHPVALGDNGCSKLFQCRYHGWTYAHDGSLRAAPGQESCGGFEKSALGLLPVKVSQFRGLIFVNVDPEAEALDSFLGNAGALLDDLDIDPFQWDHAGTFVYDIDADWKLFSENSLECYHCPLVHQNTFATYFGTQPKDYVTQEYDNFLTHHAPVTRGPLSPEATNLKPFRLLYIWPSTFISVDAYVGIIARITPLGPQRTRFTVDTFIEPGSDPKEVEAWLDVYDRTFGEDKEVVAAQQQGYRAGMVSQGRLMVQREASIQMFQRRTWQALRQDSRMSPTPAEPISFLGAPTVIATNSSLQWEGELVVKAKEEGAFGVALITLAHPTGAVLPSWDAGSHIDLVLPNGLVRQYSLCGDPKAHDSYLVGVLNESESRGGSSYVHETLEVGSPILVRGPRNHFKLPDAEHYRFIAGGIGITPIIAMIREVESRGADWTLLYGGRTEGTMAFLSELRGYGDKVSIIPGDTHGRLDLDGYLRASPDGSAICACGPGSLLDALTDLVEEHPHVQLFIERFGAAQIDPNKNTEFAVELRRSGKTLTVEKDKSVLETLRAAGVQVYSSCANGVCGTCETAVLEGVPEHRDMILSPSERRENKSMMVCVSRCKGDRLVLDV